MPAGYCTGFVRTIKPKFRVRISAATLSAKVSTPIRHRPLLMVWLGPAGSVRSRPRRRAALVTDGKLIRSCSYAVLREVQKVRKDYELSTFSRFLHFAQWYLSER